MHEARGRVEHAAVDVGPQNGVFSQQAESCVVSCYYRTQRRLLVLVFLLNSVNKHKVNSIFGRETPLEDVRTLALTKIGLVSFDALCISLFC